MSLRFKWGDEPYISEDQNDTGLRFTDVLFGFALREVVTRLVKWDQLNNASRVHLMLTLVTILGSYIGFRNSEKRGKFRLRFFNLVTIRFAVDQAMVFLYFWLALYFSTEKDAVTGRLHLPEPDSLLTFDARVVFAIFGLYLAWDLITHWMASSGKYLLKAGSPGPSEPLVAKRYRTVITFGALAACGIVLLVSELSDPTGDAATFWMVALTAILVLYRVLKDGLEPK